MTCQTTMGTLQRCCLAAARLPHPRHLALQAQARPLRPTRNRFGLQLHVNLLLDKHLLGWVEIYGCMDGGGDG